MPRMTLSGAFGRCRRPDRSVCGRHPSPGMPREPLSQRFTGVKVVKSYPSRAPSPEPNWKAGAHIGPVRFSSHIFSGAMAEHEPVAMVGWGDRVRVPGLGEGTVQFMGPHHVS